MTLGLFNLVLPPSELNIMRCLALLSKREEDIVSNFRGKLPKRRLVNRLIGIKIRITPTFHSF
jgi:hypothetical protein